jgi:putative SOS response-associated peptidase YedK
LKDDDLRENYNNSPGRFNPILVEDKDGRRKLVQAEWGLKPEGVVNVIGGDGSVKPQERSTLINARFETVAQKPTFSRLLANNRCVVVVSGYYEWKTTPSGKQPFYFQRKDGTPMALAGLFDWTPRAVQTNPQ